jgi:uncharacterized membrane protein HdeD (DUF308 family)
MRDGRTRDIFSIVAIIFGVLIIIYPQIVGYLVGIFLIVYGILELTK